MASPPEQRFFLAFGQVWCTNQRPEQVKLQVQTNPHSPAKFRVNGTVVNMPEFQKAFACKPGAAMVKRPLAASGNNRTLARGVHSQRAMYARALVLFTTAALYAAHIPARKWSAAEQERFLRTARILNEEFAGKGINGTKKAMLTDGRRRHAAHIQSIDIYQPVFKGKDGSEEKDFKDTWKFNVAAYRLAKLLHLADMIPASVERTVDGKPASVTWWLDDVLMDEKERLSKNIRPPDVAVWNRQMDTIRTFDQLIYNMDRSQENLLIGRDWKAYMIDHTRAFRKWHTLRNPAAITKCEPELLAALKALTRAAVARDLSPYLNDEEIDALMARRDLIVDKLQK